MTKFPILLAGAVVLCPSLLLAHAGHAERGITAGFLHPLSGLDHLLAMLATGIWAAQIGRPARWAVPLSFLAAMAGGGVMAAAGLHLPLVEAGIIASLFVLGVALWLAFRPPVAVGATLAAGFAIFHGYAHVAEMPVTATLSTYAAGFIAVSAAIILAGEAIGLLLARSPGRRWVRACGGAVTAAAVVLAVSVV